MAGLRWMSKSSSSLMAKVSIGMFDTLDLIEKVRVISTSKSGINALESRCPMNPFFFRNLRHLFRSKLPRKNDRTRPFQWHISIVAQLLESFGTNYVRVVAVCVSLKEVLGAMRGIWFIFQR